jgi:hypothetical protein
LILLLEWHQPGDNCFTAALVVAFDDFLELIVQLALKNILALNGVQRISHLVRDLAIDQLQQSFLLSHNLEVDSIRNVFDD